MKSATIAACLLLVASVVSAPGQVNRTQAMTTITPENLRLIRSSISRQGLEDLRKTATGLADATAEAQAKAAALEKKVNELNTQIAALESTKRQLEQDAANLRTEKDKVRADYDALVKQKAQLELDAADLATKKTSLDNLVKQAQQDRDALAARNADLQTKYDTLKRDVADTLEIQNNLKNSIAGLNGQISVLEVQKAKAETEAKDTGNKLVTAIGGIVATVLTAAGGLLTLYIKFRKAQIELKVAEGELARQGVRTSTKKPRNA